MKRGLVLLRRACRATTILYAKAYQVKRLRGRAGSVALRDWLGEAKAKQVYLVLRDRILSGAIAFGAKLSTEHELADYHGVSRVTVRRALGELARERLIERRRSAGTRVIYRPSPAPITADISGVLANLADMGRARRSNYCPSTTCRRKARWRRRSTPRRTSCCNVRCACARSTACRSPTSPRTCRRACRSPSRARNWPRGRCSSCSSVPASRSSTRASASARGWQRPTSPRRSACAPAHR